MVGRTEGRRGITLVELLIVLVVLGILVAAAIPRLDRVRTRALGAALAADLHRLRMSQEQYVADGRPSYSADLAELGFVPSEGVDLVVTEASRDGWAAVATSRRDTEVRCSVFHHLSTASGVWPAQHAGTVACARGQQPFGVPPPASNPGNSIIR